MGLLVITAWSASICSVLFFILKQFGLLRMPAEVELAGADIIKHGEAAYPEQIHPASPAQEEALEVEREKSGLVARPSWRAAGTELHTVAGQQDTDLVRPLGFRKLSDSSESQNTDLQGFSNPAFTGDTTDCGPELYTETHFGFSAPTTPAIKRVIDEDGNRTLEFNNSKESSMI